MERAHLRAEARSSGTGGARPPLAATRRSSLLRPAPFANSEVGVRAARPRAPALDLRPGHRRSGHRPASVPTARPASTLHPPLCLAGLPRPGTSSDLCLPSPSRDADPRPGSPSPASLSPRKLSYLPTYGFEALASFKTFRRPPRSGAPRRSVVARRAPGPRRECGRRAASVLTGAELGLEIGYGRGGGGPYAFG